MNPITGIPLVDWLLGILGSHGYLIVFGATVLENLFIIGSFTPGETTVMAAGFVASYTSLHPGWIALTAVVGSVIGSNASYFLGRQGGRTTLERYGRRFHISEARLRDAEEYFAVHGSKTVLLARFAAGVKNFVPMIAGVARMPLFWFELYTLVGAVIYAVLMTTLGYFFGQHFDDLLKWVQRAGYVGLGLLAAVIALVIWQRQAQAARSRAKVAAVIAVAPELLDEVGFSDSHETAGADPERRGADGSDD